MRFSDFKIVETNTRLQKTLLNEGAEARIQHAEDLVFWHGSKGAVHALEALRGLESGNHTNVTIKWDGSPAIIFGRDADGNFILTDKSGFVATGYDGRAKSADELEQMLLNRKSKKGDEIPPDYAQFAANMKDIFDEYEKAVPEDMEGFFKGDLLYYNKPLLKNGRYIFKPQLVTYTVDANSELGKDISASKTGVVVHRIIDNKTGQELPVDKNLNSLFKGNEVLVFPPISVAKAPKVDASLVNKLKQSIAKNSNAIDTLLDKAKLRELKMSDFSNILYTYTNSKVDSGLENLGADFFTWLKTSNISDVKQKRILEYVESNRQGWEAVWQVVNDIMSLKNDVIEQFDNQGSDIEQYIGDKKGGEGYVLAHPDGDIKFVNRAGFTAANRAVRR